MPKRISHTQTSSTLKVCGQTIVKNSLHCHLPPAHQNNVPHAAVTIYEDEVRLVVYFHHTQKAYIQANEEEENTAKWRLLDTSTK